MQGLKYVETLVVTPEKPSAGGDTVYRTAYFNSTINQNEIDKLLQFPRQMIINAIAQWTSEGSAWVISSVDNHYNNIVK